MLRAGNPSDKENENLTQVEEKTEVKKRPCLYQT